MTLGTATSGTALSMLPLAVRPVPEGPARTASSGAKDLDAVAAGALEQLLQAVGFERGFFLVEDRAARSRDPGADRGPRCRVWLSRQAHDGPDGDRWGEVPDPQDAVCLPHIAQALECDVSVVLDDAGAARGEGAPTPPSAAVCQTFPLGQGSRCVLYLDRSSGGGPVGEDERALFSELAPGCVACMARAVLAEEVIRLSREIEGLARSRDATGDDDDGEDAGDLELSGAESDDDTDKSPPAPESIHGIVGSNDKLRRVLQIVDKVKDSDLNVCITGESGTGKDLVARAIHEAGKRREFSFISENCGSLSENLLESELFGHVKGAFTGAHEDHKGLFELAHRGTLFLDEIGDMSESMQRKLLRVLQEGTIRPIGGKESVRVDVHVICASNRDLKLLVEQGRFRSDLYYRLNVISIEVPPLRERREDIPVLVRHFLAELAEKDGVSRRISSSAMAALLAWSWPGNVRELRNVVRRAVLTSSQRIIRRKDIAALLSAGAPASSFLGEGVSRDDDHLVLRIPAKATFNELVDECERLILSNALDQNGWNKSRVTKILGIPRQSLYNKLARYGIEREPQGMAREVQRHRSG